MPILPSRPPILGFIGLISSVDTISSSLTSPSLLLKFTKSRTYYNKVIAYLEQLDLKRKAEDSGANRLASKIRDLLNRPFKDVYIG